MGRVTVVVADDHEDARFLVRRALERHGGFEVVGEAASGSEALTLASELHPDLALIDLAMPGLDGLGTTAAIRKISPGTTVVVLSNFGAARMDAPARSAGAAAYVEKSSPDLIAVIEAALAGGRAGVGDAADPALRVILTADPAAPRAARKFVGGVLEDWGTSEDQAADVLLLVSELVTNAIVHARSDLEVCLLRPPGRLRVEIHDRDPSRVSSLAWTDDQERGRGLALVEAMSDAWGTEDVAVGKVIWFEVGRPD